MVFFAIVWGYWALKNTPLDAIPDLSDTQVIIYTDWTGRSPDLVEDQITYPISSTLLAAPKVQAVRGFSFFGSSFIYVIFEEGTDIYWARSRVLEYLQAVRNKLPAGINPVLGPDATSLGWGFSYAVVDEKGNLDLAQLRSLQDWKLKLALESVPGVSQVASVGGFVKQYQITVDPNRLSGYNIPITKVMEAVRRSNLDVEGRVHRVLRAWSTWCEGEVISRPSKTSKIFRSAQPLPGRLFTCKNVANIQLGPEIRRGVADLDGKGEVAGGIVVVRFGENVLNVIDRVKEKIKRDIEPSLPKGVKIVTTYDRSDLIRRSIATLKDEIIKLSIAVSVVCLVFLFHLPSALVVILTLPVAIIMSFILHVLPRGDLQYHEPLRHCHRHRRHGRRLDHHGGKCPQEAGRMGGTTAGPESDVDVDYRSRKRSGAVAVLFTPRDHRRLSSGLHAAGTGRKALQAPGLHEDLCHALLILSGRDADAGPHDALYQGENKVGGQEIR